VHAVIFLPSAVIPFTTRASRFLRLPGSTHRRWSRSRVEQERRNLLVTSKGGAGVAGSAIVVLVSTLAATGAVPVAAVGIILGVHRLMSSAFVSVNILGNALATIVIAGWEGAVDRAALKTGLDAGPYEVA
jgi:hypothetical protein